MNTKSNNKQPFDPDELRSLIDVMCDGVLEKQQAARLESIIASSEEAMEFYIKTMWMNESIARHSAGDSSRIDQSVFPNGDQADPKLDSTSQQPKLNSKLGADPMSIATTESKPAGHATAIDSNEKVWSQPNDAEPRSRQSAWPTMLAIACALALLAGLGVLLSLFGDGNNGANGTQVVNYGAGIKKDSDNEEPVGEESDIDLQAPATKGHNGIADLDGNGMAIPADWGSDDLLGEWKSPNDRDIEAAKPMTDSNVAAGKAQFATKNVIAEKLNRTELSDGTIVIARAGAKFSVEKPRELLLETGELYLIVAKSETPFVVKTNDGEVHATGTRFSVSAADKTQAAVAQGTVLLKSNISDIALGAGQKGTLVKSETPTRGPAKRISHLVNWAKEALAQDELLVETLPRENGLVAIDPYGQEAKLSLRKYNVDVYIEDGVARTTIDQTFFNHNPWNTEGTFYFPLPQDASVARLAMYVFGELNEGGMVTRQRGQEIYTDILYQRRDPALLEMMEGNMFKMRIFPLEGRQEKRIFLSYTQNLEELYGATKYFFPMEHTNDITQDLSIRVHIKDGARQYDPKSSTHELKATVDGDDLVLEYDAQKIKPDQDFLLNLLPQTEKPESEVRVAVCEKDGRHFLAAKLNPELTGVNEPEPRQWIVLNDVSASRSKIDIQAQRYVLNRLVTEADDDDSVFLIDVNTVARNISFKPINVRSVNVKPILNHRPEHVRGATNLGAGFKAASEVIRKHKLKNPHILYLGDGVATDGEKTIADLPRLIPRSCKFVGVGIGKKVDSLFLQEAANRTGGTFASINPNEDIDWRVFDLLASINTPRMTNIKVELLDDQDRLMEAIAYPSSTVLAAGETLTVTAMSDKSLPASIRFQGRVGTELVTKTANVEKAKTKAEYLPRLWAKRHIDELLKSDMSDKKEIISLSKDFYVVTPYTSLIVLEDDAMYKEYDVERGRKDHWASYDAPKTIEVVKEPLEPSDWWWEFEGEDSKIDVSARPKTAQEIIDNIQIRINAPFYIWNNHQSHQPSSPSRTGLYQLCNRDTSGESDPSKWLTLYYLLAAGDRKTAVDWSRSVSANSTTTATPNSMLPGSRESRKSRTGQRLAGDGKSFLGFMARPSQLKGLSLGANKDNTKIPYESSFVGSDKYYQGDGREALPMFRGLNSQIGQTVFFEEKKRDLGRGFVGLPTLSLSPEMSRSVAQAIGQRWSRLGRDIEKYNSQQGYGYGERWKQRDSINAENLSSSRLGNQIDEILDGFSFDSKDFSRLTANKLEELGGGLFLPLGQADQGRSNFSFSVYGGLDMDHRRPRMGLGVSLNRTFGNGIDHNGDGVLYDDINLAKSDLALPQMYVAASRRPIQTQPGMTAILAADHLSNRLDELDRLADQQPDGLDKTQLAQQRAMRIAIKNIEKAGARLEQNEQFWGYQGWSYHPSPQTINSPAVQIHGSMWSLDLTRYANGLYSNANDMIDEVARQYGSAKPLGKIDDQSREKIEKARSNFKPVEIRFDGDSRKFLVGPEDQFAFSSTSDMRLTEQLVCDGQQIVQIYDEIGIAARRSATKNRLNSLRQLAPHMISDVDSMIENFDVKLIKNNDRSTTIKLTIAQPAPEIDDQDEENQKQETESQTAHLIIEFDNQGRVLSRRMLIDDEELFSLDLSYDDDKVTLKWKLRLEPKTDDKSEAGESKVASFETGESSYRCKPLDATDSTFAIDLDEQVVIDMPLMKPAFYEKQIQEIEKPSRRLTILTTDGRTISGTGVKGKDGSWTVTQTDGKRVEVASGDVETVKHEPAVQHGPETLEQLISLYHHFSVSQLQDFSQLNFSSGWVNLSNTAPKLKTLKKLVGQKFKKGELTIFFATRRHGESLILDGVAGEKLKTTPLYRYFHRKHHGQSRESLEQATGTTKGKFSNGLIEHINLFDWASRNRSQENYQLFRDRFQDSPLTLALIHKMYGENFQIDEMLKLNQDPHWEGAALLSAANLHLENSEQRIAAEFWKWQEKLAKDDQHPALVDSLLRRIKKVDPKRLTKYLTTRLDEIENLDSLPMLINFTERLSGLGEKELANRGYDLIRKQLKIDSEQPTLLHRFAYGQALWAGNRYKEALQQYELILAELEKKQIQPSPGFFGAMARLCYHAGDEIRTFEFEDRALKLEQRYLPNAINLQAFRQRYTWLWNRIPAAINSIGADPEGAEKVNELIERASAMWHRWNEVDRDNAQLPAKMATLLKQAGRDEQAWEYLSTSIDKRPRDAATYHSLGSWYQQQGDLETASGWYKQAPQWDTANPQWIMSYANSLKQLGKKKEAKLEYQKVINGKWAPGLQGHASRAQKQLNEL